MAEENKKYSWILGWAEIPQENLFASKKALTEKNRETEAKER